MTQAVDVFTAEIVRNGMHSAAVEMAKTLARTAHSTLLFDVQDFGVGIVGPDGGVWGEAPGISVFTGCLGEIVRHANARIAPGELADGDVLLVNDPYLTGTHLSDVSVYMPIFAGGELIAFAISTAHWADIGAKAPGGWCPDSTDVYQEGVCFSHQRLVRAGEPNRELMTLIADNVRLPETVLGDLEAQIAAGRRGVERVRALCSRYGVDGVRRSMAHVLDRTDEAMRERIAALPDGTYEAGVTLDDDGAGASPRLQISVTVDGDRIHASFAGTSPAAAGPVNLPAIGSRGAVRVALKALLLPHDRTNDGHFRCVDFDLPPGLLTSPERPSPCDSFGYVNGAIGQLVFQALGSVAPSTASAGGLQLLAVFLSRVDPSLGKPFMFIEPVHGGNGAGWSSDGATLARFADGDSASTSTEVLELRYPLRCERFELRGEAAGPGRFRGGLGIRRDYRVLEPGIELQTANENTGDVLGRGVDAGLDGLANEVVLWPGTARERTLSRRVSRHELEVGDVVSLRSGGGGGVGSPYAREPERVAADVADGLLTADQAAAIYGVALVPEGSSWAVDVTGTEVLRERASEVPR
jgi:N-methylhydantoinase B